MQFSPGNRQLTTGKSAINYRGISNESSGYRQRAHLAGVDAAGMEKAVSSALTGGMVEGFVVGELTKQRGWSAKSTRMSHFRDDRGHEVDIILEDRRRDIVGIEVKASSSPRAADFSGLRYLRDRLEDRFVAGIVLHTGTRLVPFGDRLWALPIASLWEH